MRGNGELEDLDVTDKIAQKWGYGNVLQYLQNCWADLMVKKYHMSKEDAASAARMSKSDTEIYKKKGSAWLKSKE